MNLSTKQKQIHRHREQTCGCQGGGKRGVGWTGSLGLEIQTIGVPVVAQWFTNPTRNHEVAGSVPALALWVNNPALP